MGVIARQSSKAAILNYSGILMGVLNQIIIYPLCLSVDELGEIQFVIQTAAFFTPFILFGFSSVFTKYYPYYAKNESSKQRFYALTFLVVSVNVAVFLLLYFAFRDNVQDYYQSENSVSTYSIDVLFLIAALIPFITISRVVSAVHGRISIPSFLLQLFKFLLPLLAIAYYLGEIQYEELIYGILVMYLIVTVLFLVYMFNRERIRPAFSLRFFKNDTNVKPIFLFALFSLLTGIGSTFINQIDILMITTMKGTYANGLYSWSLFIANAVAVPFGLVGAISSPMVAKYWKENQIDKIAILYRQTSSTLLSISLGVFIAFWIGIDDLFQLMPKGDEYKFAKTTVFILCSNVIVDLASGINNQILSLSKYYKVLLWFILGTALLNVSLNLLLIPKYSMEGSAVATIISISLFNVSKYYYIKNKFKITPFTINTLYIVLLGVVLCFLINIVPKTNYSIVNIFLYSGVFALLYFGLIYKLNLAPEINNFANKQLLRLGIKPFDGSV